jgi:tRNA threonylcarbamoyladenosine biosynthesis protein TsaE
MEKVTVSSSEAETLALAESLGRNARAGDVFALYGDLGTGKTVIARGIARGLGIPDDITSPTFTLLDIYDGGRLTLYHFDLYRVENELELDYLGFEEYWEGEGVSVIEWAGRAESRLPERSIKIRLEYAGGPGRGIRIEYPHD